MIQITEERAEILRKMRKGGVFYDYILCGNGNTEAA